MARLLSAIAERVLSSGERAALQAFLRELRLSHYHRQGVRRIRRQHLSRPSKLNLGSGSNCVHGFLNIDALPGGDLTLDLRRGLPFEANCAEFIFSEHFLEHVGYPEPVSHLFRECLRVLKPGGVLKVSVPDSGWPLTDYQVGPDAPYFRACADHPWWHPGSTTRMEHINYHFRQNGQHLFAYDEETLRTLLASCGFVQVTVRPFEPGLDAELRRVGSLFMTATKAETAPKPVSSASAQSSP